MTIVSTVWLAVALYLLVRASRRLGRVRRYRRILVESQQNGVLLIAANANVRRAKLAIAIAVLALVATAVYVLMDPSDGRGAITGSIVIAILAAYTWSCDRDDHDSDQQLKYADPPYAPRRRKADIRPEDVSE